MTRRTVFFVSDQTGVTAETLGHSLLTQFEGSEFDCVTLPFLDTVDKIDGALSIINDRAAEEGAGPIIFSTLVHDNLRKQFKPREGVLIDCQPWKRNSTRNRRTSPGGRTAWLIRSVTTSVLKPPISR